MMESEAGHFFRDLGRQIVVAISEPLLHQYLLQQVAIAVKRGNVSAILRTAESDSAAHCE